MSEERVPRIRLREPSDDSLLVVRGDALDPTILRADAARFQRRFPDWSRYGVSAFLTIDDGEIDALCETRLEAFDVLIVFGRSDLEAADVEDVPTFRRPHVTIAHAELDPLVSALLTCEHRTLNNPRHHERGGGTAS